MNYFKFLLFLFIIPTTVFAQHTISVTFSPAEDYSWAILYKTTPTNNKFIAQGEIKEGKLMFKLGTEAQEGIYKLTYAAPQEIYNFDVIYTKKEDIIITFNEETGVVFQQSLDNILLDDYLNNMSVVNTQIGEFYVQERQDTDSLIQLFNKQRTIQTTFEKKAEGSLSSSFIKANRPYIPNQYEDDTTYITNLTGNYFSYIDFNDPTLQSSRFLMDRSIGYIVGVLPEGLDKTTAFNNNIDTIEAHLSKTEKNYHKIFLDRLWNRLVLYTLTDNANYLAASYLIPLAKAQGDMQLAKKLIDFKNLSIGNIAPDFSWETEENGIKKVHKFSELAVAENYILVFWSTSCSHCLEELPKLNAFVKTLDKTTYKVIAIGLETEAFSWKNEINYYPDFIHVLGLGKWDNKIGKAYNITGTPSFFLLDKNKKFILKPETLEELEDFIRNNSK